MVNTALGCIRGGSNNINHQLYLSGDILLPGFVFKSETPGIK
jgi:hypothetical protein